MIRQLRVLWDRWKITLLFVGLVAVSLAVYHVNDVQNSRRVDAACASVTQVKTAALSLAKPISAADVTDPATLERLRVANAARAQARRLLEDKLACK